MVTQAIWVRDFDYDVCHLGSLDMEWTFSMYLKDSSNYDTCRCLITEKPGQVDICINISPVFNAHPISDHCLGYDVHFFGIFDINKLLVILVLM